MTRLPLQSAGWFARMLTCSTVLLLLSLGGASAGHALVAVAEGELVVAATAKVEYDDNALGESVDPQEDMVLTLSPEVRWQRAGTRGSLEAMVGMHLGRFADLDSLDYEDLHARLRASIPPDRGTRVHGSATLEYVERSDIDYVVLTRVDTSETLADLDISYRFHPRFAFRGGLLYRRDEAELFADRTRWVADGGLSYLTRRGFQLFGTLRYSEAESAEAVLGRDLVTESTGLTVGVSGPLTERISGTIYVGYQQTSYVEPFDRDENFLIARARLDYQMRPQTVFALNLDRDVSISIDNRNYLTTRAIVSWRQTYRRGLASDLEIGYQVADFRNEDAGQSESLWARAGLTWAWREHYRFGADLRYDEYSGESDNDVERLRFGVRATVAY